MSMANSDEATATVLRFDGAAALIGGGDLGDEDLALARSLAPAVIAADGGANHFQPDSPDRLDAVIGDMDSVENLDAWRADPNCRVVEISEQDTTDFEKCLYTVDASVLIGFGFFGARLDHTLATLNALAKHEARHVLLVGAEDVAFLAPPRCRLSLWAGARVSIVPAPQAKAQSSRGLRWPLDDLAFSIGGMLGTSNEATEPDVEAVFVSGAALILLERAGLDAALRCVYDWAIENRPISDRATPV